MSAQRSTSAGPHLSEQQPLAARISAAGSNAAVVRLRRRRLVDCDHMAKFSTSSWDGSL
jgi:hypothetical protein